MIWFNILFVNIIFIIYFLLIENTTKVITYIKGGVEKKICYIIAICIFLGYSGRHVSNIYNAKKEKRYENNDKIFNYIDDNSNYIYLVPIRYGLGCNVGKNVFNVYSKDYCNNLFLLGGWPARLPGYVEQLESKNIDNPMTALFNTPNVYSIFDEDVYEYLKLHYGKNITYRIIDIFDNDIYIVQYYKADDKEE